MSSNFINNLKELERKDYPPTSVQHDDHVLAHHLDSHLRESLKGKVVLDLTKDPDPYGYHGIPLSTRLQYMGWT